MKRNIDMDPINVLLGADRGRHLDDLEAPGANACLWHNVVLARVGLRVRPNSFDRRYEMCLLDGYQYLDRPMIQYRWHLPVDTHSSVNF